MMVMILVMRIMMVMILVMGIMMVMIMVKVMIGKVVMQIMVMMVACRQNAHYGGNMLLMNTVIMMIGYCRCSSSHLKGP